MNQKLATTKSLEQALIYSCIVAGKSAKFADAVMARMLADVKHSQFDTLIEFLRWAHADCAMDYYVKHWRTGNYGKLSRCFSEIALALSPYAPDFQSKNPKRLNLRTCTVADLEAIHGIGPKTSRMLMGFTRPRERHAILDVHILRWLRANGHPDAPKSTPSPGKIYDYWQVIFIAIADRLHMTPRELDREIWLLGSKYLNKPITTFKK